MLTQMETALQKHILKQIHRCASVERICMKYYCDCPNEDGKLVSVNSIAHYVLQLLSFITIHFVIILSLGEQQTLRHSLNLHIHNNYYYGRDNSRGM